MKYNGYAEARIFDKENKKIYHANVYFDGSDLNHVMALGLFSSRGFGILRDYLAENNIPYTHILMTHSDYNYYGIEKENQVEIVELENYELYADTYCWSLYADDYNRNVRQYEHDIKYLAEYRYDDKEDRWIRRI